MSTLHTKWITATRYDVVECPTCGYVGNKSRTVSAAGSTSHCSMCGYVRDVTTPMKDTPMDLNPDPMCVPTMATFKEWGDADSYALDLKSYIEFVVNGEGGTCGAEGEAVNGPMHPAAIY